jgi:hypothetical protein
MVNSEFYSSLLTIFLFEAFSRFPLYLFGYGFRFAPPATQKDVIAIEARVAVVIFSIEIITKFVILKETNHESFHFF